MTTPTGFINKTVTLDGKTSRYVVYVPFEYDPGQAWPLILFLHGAGERGDDGMVQTEVGIGTAIRRHPERFPAIVVFPQCPRDNFYSAILDVMEAQLAATRAEFNIDDERVYLTGLSMGGFGTWLWGAVKTDTFAALMPICGGGRDRIVRDALGMTGESPFGTFETRVKQWASVPVWAFHGGADGVVAPEQSREVVEAIRASGGTQIRYTEYEGVGHDSWNRAYDDPQAIAWLLRQRKGQPEAE